MSLTPPTHVPRRRRWLWALLALAAVASVGYVWSRRPPPPPPLTVDLSRSEPDVVAAVNQALATVAEDPRSAVAWGELGMVLRAHDFEADSVAAFRAAEQLNPTDWRWPYLQGLTQVLLDPDAGLASLRRAADRSPVERPEPRLRLAEVLVERGQTDEAGATARAVLDHNGADSRAAFILARMAADRGDWAAVLPLTAPHRDDPACRKRVAALRGEAHHRLNESGPAAGEWKRAADLPDDTNWPDPLVQEVVGRAVGKAARMRQASELLVHGRPDAAVDLLREAIRRSPDAADAQLLLGQTFIRFGDYDAARSVLRELTARVPDSVEGWFQLGVADFLRGDAAAAAESFTKVVNLKPDHTLGYFNLGHARKKLGDRAGAVAAFEAALRCRPDHEPTRAALADVRAGK